MSRAVTILDGPMGTELAARGIDTPLPGWSAHALETAPDIVARIHADYAAAGATVHTSNTFRARPDVFGDRWADRARLAVELARKSVPADHRIAGSIAPLADCYRPDLSPADGDPDGTREQHAALVSVLAEAGCDLLLCETFPHTGEAMLALDAALATGLPAWVCLTPGFDGSLLSPDELAATCVQAVDAGAAGIGVNCVPAKDAHRFVRAIVEAVRPAHPDTDIIVYANAGEPDDKIGWHSPGASADAPARYAALAKTWADAGATVIGGCCGTGLAHIRALSDALH